jgi:hypothetical protein
MKAGLDDCNEWPTRHLTLLTTARAAENGLLNPPERSSQKHNNVAVVGFRKGI